jgi:hypothetical protein
MIEQALEKSTKNKMCGAPKALTHALPRSGLPIYVARVPAAPFTHCFPRSPAAAGSLIPFAPLYLARSRSARPLPVAALPAMSLIPFAPFDEAGARNGLILTRCCAREHVKRPIFLAL